MPPPGQYRGGVPRPLTFAIRTVAAGLFGFGLSCAFDPVGMPYLVPLCLAALALCLRGLRARAGFVVALVFGGCFYFTHIWWMKESIGAAAWLGLAGVETLFIGLFGAVAAVLLRLRLWPAWLAIAWTGVEVVRSEWPFSGMPWGRLGFAAVDTPVAPALAYVGINGVTLLVALLGFLLARLVLSTRGERLPAVAAVVLVAAAMLTPAVHPFELKDDGEVTVAAVQGSVPGRGNDILADYRGVTENHTEATVALAQRVRLGEVSAPDFVLWPENATAVDPVLDTRTRELIDTAVQAIGVPILVGAIVDDGPDHVLNQGIVWNPGTGPAERYTKWHPVPYGEYIPFRAQMERFGLTERGQLARIGRDMRSGRNTEPISIAGIEVADSICFDIAYDDVFATQIEHGAQLVVVQTSNASFVFTDQLEQQFAITRARAIESGKATVVASTNGITGAIGPDGEVADRTQRLVQDVVVETLPLRSGVTPGTRIGRVLRLLTPAGTLLALLFGVVTYRLRHDRRPRSRPGTGARDHGDSDLQRAGEPSVGDRTAAP